MHTPRRRAMAAALYIIAPLLLFGGYMLMVAIWPPTENRWLYKDRTRELYNPAEWTTVICFLAAGIVALRLAVRTRRRLPRQCVWLYAAFGIVAIVMAGEEMSWGQHIFRIESPEIFQQLNDQQEMNLHNLAGDKPSVVLRRLSEIGFPIVLVILPALHLWLDKRAYTRGHWPYYILPKGEAMVATLLGNLYRPLDKSGWFEDMAAGELAEAMWALAVLLWATALLRRHAGPAAGAGGELPKPQSPRTFTAEAS